MKKSIFKDILFGGSISLLVVALITAMHIAFADQSPIYLALILAIVLSYLIVDKKEQSKLAHKYINGITIISLPYEAYRILFEGTELDILFLGCMVVVVVIINYYNVIAHIFASQFFIYPSDKSDKKSPV